MASGRISEWVNIPDVDPFPGGYQTYKYLGYEIFNGVTAESYINKLNAPVSTPIPYTGAGQWMVDFFTALMSVLQSEAVELFDPAPNTWTDPSAEIISWSYNVVFNSPNNSAFVVAMNNSGAPPPDVWGVGGTFYQVRLKIWESISETGVPFGAAIEAYLEANEGRFDIVTESYKPIE